MGIPPFIQQVIGVLVRVAVVKLADKLGIVLSDSQVVQVTTEIVAVVAVIAWSVWQKYRGRQKLMTAQASKHTLTEHEVEDLVSNPNVPTPSVMTPKNEVPQ